MISRLTRSQLEQYYGKEYINDAKESLATRDENQDGSVSADEIVNNYAKTYQNVFRCDEKSLAKAGELADSQRSIFQQYAGDDGILDEYEFVEALNSDENKAILDEFWALQDQMNENMGFDVDERRQEKMEFVKEQEPEIINLTKQLGEKIKASVDNISKMDEKGKDELVDEFAPYHEEYAVYDKDERVAWIESQDDDTIGKSSMETIAQNFKNAMSIGTNLLTALAKEEEAALSGESYNVEATKKEENPDAGFFAEEGKDEDVKPKDSAYVDFMKTYNSITQGQDEKTSKTSKNALNDVKKALGDKEVSSKEFKQILKNTLALIKDGVKSFEELFFPKEDEFEIA